VYVTSFSFDSIISSATFTMTGGTISGNSTGTGGGVFINGNGSNFIMSGGTISGNTGNGGGVYMEENATFSKSGNSIIYGNDAEASLRNNIWRTNDKGYAVYWRAGSNASYYRNATSGTSNNMSTSDYPLPTSSGQTVGSWTRN